MKRRIMHILLSVCMILTVLAPVPTAYAATAAPTTDAEVRARIDELYGLLGGKYFTVSGKRCYHNGKFKGSNACRVNYIMNSSWFKNMFGNVAPSQLFMSGGASCVGFVEFAEWYIYRANNSDNVRRDDSAIVWGVPLTYENISKYAGIGDYLWYNDQHAIILVDYNSAGITVLDSNWDHDCKVQMHTISYNSKKINICKLYSATQGRNNSTSCTSHQKGKYLWYEQVHPHYNYWRCSVCGRQFSDGSTSKVDSCSLCKGTNQVATPAPAATKISFSDLTTPGNLTEGTGGHINGYIYSSSSPICSVSAQVYNESGNAVLSASSSGFSVSKYGPLNNSKIDAELKFGSLPAGTYSIQYTAKAKDGTTATTRTDAFTITGKVPTPVPEPTPTPTPTPAPTPTPTHDTHTKGAFQFAEEVHPHRNYYKCSVCGENFTDGTTSTLDSCQICNPVKEDIWTPWSDWSTTPAYASATREVETKTEHVAQTETQYRYGRYANVGHDCWCSTYLARLGYGSSWYEATDWSTQRFSTSGRDWTCGSCGGSHTGVDHYGSDGRPWWKEYKSPDGLSYYWEESRTVDNGSDVTYYRYRDKIN